ncbi:hypothetical protein [Amycolatopsis sp. 195334CR]|uniref:hypothetical protein n=1 Tax=Amycolatopsis sp. 195334CR TaxID=2814588 RepID=UPI001A8D8BB2|nr:hypothetical protein [Amycolatopsis sp. 195334CR]MBN6034061.1 hypothetical protein [Amycolatopsis sp. 195334CR]
MNEDTDPSREPHGLTPEREPGEVAPDDADQDAVAEVLADGPLAMAGLYRLASAADRAHIDEELDELLHTLDRMPSSVAEPWLAEARFDRGRDGQLGHTDNQRAERQAMSGRAEEREQI